jgi:hypothetical protein
MTFEREQEVIAEIKRYIGENLPLSELEDDYLW